MLDFFLATSADGLPVAETVWEDSADIWDLRARAGRAGARLLWVHGGDLARFGLARRPGYTKLTTALAEPGRRLAVDPLPVVSDAATAFRVLERCFAGQWGHHLAEPEHLTFGGGQTLQLAEAGAILGLCRVSARTVDDLGLIPEARDPARYRRMLAGACAFLGPGPVTVQSWGQPPAVIAAWESLGFTVVESDAGWEAQLGEQEAGQQEAGQQEAAAPENC
jgi:hypothetical protein